MSDENGLPETPEATEGFAKKVIQGACDRLAPALVTISPDLPRFETFSAGVFEFPSFEEAPAPWMRAIQLPLWPHVHPRLARSVRVDAARTPDLVFCSYGVSAGEERYSDRVINLATGGMLLESEQTLPTGAHLVDIEMSSGTATRP